MFSGYDYDASIITQGKISPKTKNHKFSFPNTGDRVNTGTHLKQNRQATYSSSHHTQNT